MVLFLGWIFSLTRDTISKLFFVILLPSLALSVWFEREHTHHRLDEMLERIEVLQRHITVIITALCDPPVIHELHSQSNPAVPALIADARGSLPVMTKTMPEKLETLNHGMQGVAQPTTTIPEKQKMWEEQSMQGTAQSTETETNPKKGEMLNESMQATVSPATPEPSHDKPLVEIGYTL